MDELTIQWPDAGLERVEAAKQSLRLAGEWLRAQPHAEVLERLTQWFDLWSDGDSKWRRELQSRLADTSGFAPEMLRAGLDLGLSDWTGAALRELVRQELDSQLRDERQQLAPFALTSVLLAGTIPMPNLLQCVVPLLLQSPVLVKSSARDTVTAELAARSLAELDPDLGRCIEVVNFQREDRECTASLLEADCVVASGSDETMREIGGQLAIQQRFVAYGHRVSLALVGPGAPASGTDGDVESLADALSRDIGLWDQLGCLSPVAIYVVDPDPDAALADRLAEALHHALAQRQREWPRGDVEPGVAATIRRERAEAEMRRAGGPGEAGQHDERSQERVVLYESDATHHTVVRECDASWRPAPLHRFVRLHPVRDLEALQAALEELAPHISAVATAGFDAERDEGAFAGGLGPLLRGLGVSRVCPRFSDSEVG